MSQAPAIAPRQLHKIENAHDDSVWSVACAGDCFVSGSVDESVKVWDWKSTDQPRHTFGSNGLAVVSVDVTADAKTVVSTSMDGHLRAYDLGDGKKVASIAAGSAEVWTVSCHPTQSNIAASGTHQGGINVWDLKAPRKLQTINTEGKFTMSVCYAPNGALLGSGSYDGVVHVFDTETGKSIHKLPGHVKAVRSLCFTRDSACLVTASDDARVNVYDVKGGQQICSLSGHASWVLDVDVSAKGNYFVSCGTDKKVKLWDFKQRECVHTFETHQDQVWSVCFNREGTQFVTGSDDKTIQIFDLGER